jgi:hypothetical protein
MNNFTAAKQILLSTVGEEDVVIYRYGQKEEEMQEQDNFSIFLYTVQFQVNLS